MIKKYVSSLITTTIATLMLTAPIALESQEIHSFVTADTLSNLKNSVRVDMKSIKKLIRSISQSTQIPYTSLMLTHKDLTRSNLFRIIDATNINPDDIVFFYYTGHGCRTMETRNMWPCIYFTKPRERVDLSDIVDVLLSKKASLYVVIADCCNDYKQLDLINAHSLSQKKLPSKNLQQQVLRSLFSQQNLLIIASGSTPGQLSWTTQDGSIFTNAFIKSLEIEAHREEAQWERVLQRTVAFCKKYQTVQFSISTLNAEEENTCIDEDMIFIPN